MGSNPTPGISNIYMANQELLDYIKQSVATGNSEEQIRSVLLQHGWISQDIDQAFGEIKNQNNLQPPDFVKKKNIFVKTLLIPAGLIILVGIGYFIFRYIQDKPFKNGNEVFGKIRESFKQVKSFQIDGYTKSLERSSFEGTLDSDFTGQVVLPKTLQTKSVVADITKGREGTETRNYTDEVIAVNDKVFTKQTAGDKVYDWKLKDVIDNPLSKKFAKEAEKQGLALPTEKKSTSWLALYYAADLIYVGKEGVTQPIYHYKIVPNQMTFAEARGLLQTNFLITVGPGSAGNVNSLVKGEIWLDRNFRITKEKYLIPVYASEEDRLQYHYQEKEGVEIQVSYSRYNESFDIKQPIDTSAIDEFYKQIEAGKDPAQAEKAYEERIHAENPNLAIQERDQQRYSHMRQLGTALEVYLDDHGEYPVTLNALNEIGIAVPSAPTPADGNCTEEQNIYKYTRNSPSTFQVSFCLGGSVASLSPGPHIMAEGATFR